MLLRLIIGLILTVLTYAVNAQQDSILLEAVTVYGLPEEKYLTDSSVYSVDSSMLRILEITAAE